MVRIMVRVGKCNFRKWNSENGFLRNEILRNGILWNGAEPSSMLLHSFPSRVVSNNTIIFPISIRIINNKSSCNRHVYFFMSLNLVYNLYILTIKFLVKSAKCSYSQWLVRFCASLTVCVCVSVCYNREHRSHLSANQKCKKWHL